MAPGSNCPCEEREDPGVVIGGARGLRLPFSSSSAPEPSITLSAFPLEVGAL